MSIISAIVLYLIIWFLIFLILLPINIKTQGEKGKILPGTHAGAPETHFLKQKTWLTFLISLIIWLIIVSVIKSEILSPRKFDLFELMHKSGHTNLYSGFNYIFT